MGNNFSKIPDGCAYGGVLTLDLAALAHNYRLIAARVAPARMSAVVKSNAYGLGIKHVAPVLYHAGCRLFFVAQIIEAYRLRPLLPQAAEIAILNDIYPSQAGAVADAGFLPVLNCLESVQEWQELCRTRQKKLPCFIQIDSGMSRFGLDRRELEVLVNKPDIFHLADVRALISHLACADEPSHHQNHTQYQRFKKILAQLPPVPAALANSAGIFLPKQSQDFIFDLVRPGLALYGVDPFGNQISDLHPVIALHARVAQIRETKAGDLIGYGATYQAPYDMPVATIGVGYADGLHRALGNKGAAFYQDIRLPIIGRISMDSITLDISALPVGTLKRGHLVELIGPNQTIHALAQDADTIPYEILTSLGQRFEQIYIKPEEES